MEPTSEKVFIVMSEVRLSPRQVLVFSQDEKEFRPSEAFINDLKTSNRPFIIMFVGDGRAGKSTRANQLVKHELQMDEPFDALNGSEPVTMKFQYAGPIKFAHLANTHNLQLHVDNDPDIFIIDCEGLHSLGLTTATLKQATFALSQIVSMTVLVMNGQINLENINDVRSLFMLSHAFSCELHGFEIGTTIMMREVGVRPPKGQQLSSEAMNSLRREADASQKRTILEKLNQAQMHFFLNRICRFWVNLKLKTKTSIGNQLQISSVFVEPSQQNEKIFQGIHFCSCLMK
jgi:hypothetical protein